MRTDEPLIQYCEGCRQDRLGIGPRVKTHEAHPTQLLGLVRVGKMDPRWLLMIPDRQGGLKIMYGVGPC